MRTFWILVFTFSTSLSQAAKPLKIVIDPGHGGIDQGAVRSTVKESAVVLNVAKILQEILKSDTRFQVVMTRDKDITKSLKARVEMANQIKADLFLSLHANTESTEKVQGVEFYFQNQMSPDEEAFYYASLENRILSETKVNEEISKKATIDAIVADLKRQNSLKNSHRLSIKMARVWERSSKTSVSVRQAPFFVVVKTEMPAVLVELGYLSNPIEATRLNTNEYQKELAQKIYMGLLDFKEMVDNTRIAGL